MFTQDNTAGYSNEELAALNGELAQRLEDVADDEERAAVEQAFADEVSGR